MVGKGPRARRAAKKEEANKNNVDTEMVGANAPVEPASQASASSAPTFTLPIHGANPSTDDTQAGDAHHAVTAPTETGLEQATGGLSIRDATIGDINEFAEARAGPLPANQAMAALRGANATERVALMVGSIVNLDENMTAIGEEVHRVAQHTSETAKEVRGEIFIAGETARNVDGYTETLRRIIETQTFVLREICRRLGFDYDEILAAREQ